MADRAQPPALRQRQRLASPPSLWLNASNEPWCLRRKSCCSTVRLTRPISAASHWNSKGRARPAPLRAPNVVWNATRRTAGKARRARSTCACESRWGRRCCAAAARRIRSGRRWSSQASTTVSRLSKMYWSEPDDTLLTAQLKRCATGGDVKTQSKPSASACDMQQNFGQERYFSEICHGTNGELVIVFPC